MRISFKMEQCKLAVYYTGIYVDTFSPQPIPR